MWGWKPRVSACERGYLGLGTCGSSHVGGAEWMGSNVVNKSCNAEDKLNAESVVGADDVWGAF